MISRGPALPAAFRRLWASDALSSAGDGFTLVAAPLLMTTLTSSPVLIAGAAAAQQVPWLLFGLYSGTIVDRVDQRLLLMRVDAARAVLLAVLAVAIVTDHASVALAYAVLFLSGTGDTLVVTASSALVPRIVGHDLLTRANSRLMATRIVGATLLARPVGAFLFAHGESTPFFVDAVSFALGVVLLRGLPVGKTPSPGAPRGDRRVRAGLHLLWQDAVLRVLALCIFVMNITLSGTLAIFVLVARDRLGLSVTGYGVLLGALALGGLVGTALVDPLLARFGVVALLAVGLLIEAGTQLTFAVTRSAWVAGAALAVFGVHSSVWSVLTVTLRQARASDEVRGRIMAAYMVLSVGGAALGAALGGLLAEYVGLTAPMWFGTVAVLGVFALAVPALRRSDVRVGAGR
jgi:MFS family permease